jgi:hypothetical protein
VLTEIKRNIGVVAEMAEVQGVPVVFVGNLPWKCHRLDKELLWPAPFAEQPNSASRRLGLTVVAMNPLRAAGQRISAFERGHAVPFSKDSWRRHGGHGAGSWARTRGLDVEWELLEPEREINVERLRSWWSALEERRPDVPSPL